MPRLTRSLAGLLLLAGATLLARPDAALAQPPAGGEAAAPSPQDKAKAMKKFRQGRAAFAAGQFDKALAALRESYSIMPSPNSRLLIVHTLVELGRTTDAYEEARAVAAEAEEAAVATPKYAKTATAARDEMEKLRGSVGLIQVEVAGIADLDDATLTVAGRSIESSQWNEPIAVDPGPVHVKLVTSNETFTRDVEVAAGAQHAVRIAPPRPQRAAPPPPEPAPVEPDDGDDEGSSPLRAGAYVGLAVGGAGMLAFTIFGVLTQNEFSKLEEDCPDNRCPATRDQDADDGRAYQTVANVSLVVGLVGLTAGASLLIADLAGDGDEDESASASRPTVAIGPGSIVVSGTF